uniref:Uncharacterized protein n=1 Tax=Nothoprocta perdicaria TaxID=30464 RepID=A0A8C6YRP2_NOTPE
YSLMGSTAGQGYRWRVGSTAAHATGSPSARQPDRAYSPTGLQPAGGYRRPPAPPTGCRSPAWGCCAGRLFPSPGCCSAAAPAGRGSWPRSGCTLRGGQA